MSTRGDLFIFILEINKLEKKRKKANKKQTKKAPAKQRATKKANTYKKCNQKSTSKAQRVVWRGRVGLVLDKGLFWCRVKSRTFGRSFFRRRVRSRTCGRFFFPLFFAVKRKKSDKSATFYSAAEWTPPKSAPESGPSLKSAPERGPFQKLIQIAPESPAELFHFCLQFCLLFLYVFVAFMIAVVFLAAICDCCFCCYLFAFVIAFVFLVAFCDCLFLLFFQYDKLLEQRGLADTSLAQARLKNL